MMASPYRDVPINVPIYEVKVTFQKKIDLDSKHYIELALAENGFVYITMRAKGLMSSDNKWNGYDWFMSQLTFPSTTFDEIERVVKPWLTIYTSGSVPFDGTFSIVQTLREATKDKKDN